MLVTKNVAAMTSAPKARQLEGRRGIAEFLWA
jgi:hypothetical protein